MKKSGGEGGEGGQYWLLELHCREQLAAKNCLQRGLNSRPLLYETSALPLSYRGLAIHL